MRPRVQPHQDQEEIEALAHRLHCHLKVLSLNIHLHYPKGTFALAQSNFLPPIQQNNNPPAVSVTSTTSGTVLSGIELSYPLLHTLSSAIGYNMFHISSVNLTPSLVFCIAQTSMLHNHQKIWAKYYIDLSKLIQPDPDTDKTYQHKFAILDGQLVMTPKTNPKKITSLETQTGAFIAFASIYLTRHSADIQGILKYIQTIRYEAGRNPNASTTSSFVLKCQLTQPYHGPRQMQSCRKSICQIKP